MRRRAIPFHDGKQGIEHLLLPRVIALPACRRVLAHGLVEVERELRFRIILCRALKGRRRNAGEVIKEHNGF